MSNKPLFIDDDELSDNDLINIELGKVQDGITNHDNEDGYDFQFFGKFAVNEDWVEKYNGEIRIPHESHELRLLREDLYNIFVNSVYYEKYGKIKKVSKQDMLKVFLYFFDNIQEKQRYTIVDKFIEIVDFMNMNYDVMYKELPMLYKQNLIAELDNTYNIFDKRKIHKLF